MLADIAKLSKHRRRKTIIALGKMEWEKCAEDPMYWLDAERHAAIGPYVYTLDPHPLYKCLVCKDDATHHFNKRDVHLELRHQIVPKSEAELRGYFKELPTTRPFPILEYFEPITRYWVNEQLMVIEKSRDMMATWLIVALYCWDTFFHYGRQNIFQSEDASKTLELVKRAKFIFDNQPKFLRYPHKAQFAAGQNRSGSLVIPSLESEILGFPQGPDQIRQYHPSGVFQDEAAYQEHAGDAFASIKPAIQNGGRFTAVSSANPGWFYLVATDRLNEDV